MTLPIYHAMSGVLKRKGRADTAIVPFVLGFTLPVAGVNCGLDPSITLTPYAGANAGGTRTVSAPETFNNINFGSTRLVVNASDVVFNNCLWDFTGVATVGSGDGALIDFRGGSTYSGRQMNRCEVRASSQWAPAITGVMGYGFKMDRCYLHDLSDHVGTYVPSSRPDTAIDVQILGSILTDLSFYATTGANGIVHPSDDHTHNDLIQHQGGRGLVVEGCVVDAKYSTTVGTGTPNSGNDTGGVSAASAPYSQATAVSLRNTWVGTTHLLGGAIAALQFNAVRGSVMEAEIINNWGDRGAAWINAADTGLTGAFGQVTGNRIGRNQRDTVGGVPRAIAILTALTATVSGNVWTDDGTTVPRVNV